jgi:hypothetical protein
MTTLREAAQQALEALIARGQRGDGAPDTVAALRAALAQEEPFFVVTRCQFFGDPPAPHQSWNAFFAHATQTRTFADVCISALPRRTGMPHCERSCEANAFKIEIRRLTGLCDDLIGQLTALRAAEQMRKRIDELKEKDHD